MNFTIVTLGCKVNQYESQAMEQWLTQRGHTEVGPDEAFDLAIVNTCTVTAVADKKNRNVIRRIRKQSPGAVVAVCGCYSQVKPEDIRDLGVDVISGSAGREAFLELALQTVADRQRREALDEALKRRQFEILPAGGLSTRTRSMLKVQDGCSNFCSYCIIPYARGPVRSLPLAEAVAQAKQLAAEGYREIVITGIEIASWGWDFHDGSSLVQLLDAICAAVPAVRIRLGSLEPRIIDQAFCRVMAAHKNLCPHFHLSMQSGSDTVLDRMRRKYDTARYYESVALLNSAFPGCAVTTDMIVGFPGETEAEFAESLAFIRKCGFAAMHVFPYSRRPGTPADKMPGQLGNAVKEARSAAAIAVAGEMNRAFRERMIGTVQAVLFEEEAAGGRQQINPTAAQISIPQDPADDDRLLTQAMNGAQCAPLQCWTGHAPNSIRVYAPGEALHNQVLPVRITGLYEDGLLGETVL
ncbi:MAG: tRNA (N(6)-L-threonylcarbamoyladenosine(37)-C(2))-methylthiotransferase MtaB [Oscillospiraceae bacterium]|nr:tRNA (N(6)-L-threonylcarbamoyladenosine(37)-C(2))-methylthiotransferase MtaB [Oscillospiraceae bacterium]